MRDQYVLDAWLAYTRETLRLIGVAGADRDRIVRARAAEGRNLWLACLKNGWTREEGDAALKARGDA